MPIQEITNEMAENAAKSGWEHLQKKVQEKGDRSFSGQDEAYGVLLEEFDELRQAVHLSDQSLVRKELLDIFVPCVFEMAALHKRDAMLDQTLGPHRVLVEEAKALKVVTDLQDLLPKKKTQTSIHHILGRVARDFRLLEHLQMEERSFSRALHPLALSCLRGIASIDSKTMDW